MHPNAGRMHVPNAEPTYKLIKAAAVKINGNVNANAIHSNGGDRNLGHLIITVGNTEYQAMSDGGVAFAIPTAPPIHPVYPVITTGHVITEANRRHREEVCVFHKNNGTDAAIKHQLMGAVDDDYVVELKHAKLEYANVTTLDLLYRIRDRYGMINTKIMDANAEKMTQPWA